MMPAFNPQAWYWLADDGRVYSAPLQTITTAADSGYAAFLAAGNKATRWPLDNSGAQTNASLSAVINPYDLFISVADGLIAYAAARLAAITNGGITVNVGTSDAPVNVAVDTTPDGKSNLAGILLGYSVGGDTGNFTWYQTSGQLSLSQAQLLAVSQAVKTFVANVYAVWEQIVAAINAGTITTRAQVDNPPSPIPAWPVNS